jgi:hypothetical protein
MAWLALMQLPTCIKASEQNSPLNQSPEQATGQKASDSGRLTNFVVPVQMMKLTLTSASSSNRLEINHFQPLSHWDKAILFFDNTIYGKARPLGEAGAGLPDVETWGESFRLGYRKLIQGGRGYLGFNGGYDNALQQGYLYQQLGIGVEAIYPKVAIVATLTQGIGNSYYQNLNKALLSSFNIQAAFATGIPNLSVAPRFYYVDDGRGEQSPGGQLQLVYGVNRHLSVSLSANYDDLNGKGSSLQFRYLFHPPDRKQVPAAIPYGIASGFSQAIGNTGSRIIRLTGSPPAYGD